MNIRIFAFTTISLLTVLLDQWTKYLVRHRFVEGKSIKLIGSFIYLTYVKNRGAAFGIMQGGRWIFILIGAVVSVLILINIKPLTVNGILLLGSSLLLGGIVGNIIDRLFLGFVTDFIDLRFWPVFNVADSAVDIGLLLVLVYFIFYGNGKNIKIKP